MKTLILTEKPSVARDFAVALGIRGKKDGFMEGEEYVITWAVGHLVELAAPEDYDPKWKKWNIDSLPILPEELKYKPISNVEKQLNVVKKQVRRDDVGQIIIATDAGREGEVIARTILEMVGHSRKTCRRFWTSQALTPQVIRDTLSNLRPSSDYDRLWHAGQSRQAADWFVGMNLSRAATLKMRREGKDVFSVGRVQTAVLALLVDRKRTRENFKPQPYWLLRANFSNPKGNWWGTWFKGEENRFTKKEEVERILALIIEQTGIVKSVKRQKKKLPPPLLYSLTDLQRDANTRFGLSAQKTLEVAQNLYEQKKCLSYPRTDSKVLGSKNVDMIKSLVSRLSSAYPDLFAGVEHGRIGLANKRVFNDAKLTDHHALIPLAPLPSGVTRDEKLVFDLVLYRFAAAFHADYEYEATELITEVREETFRTQGNRPLKAGWKAVYGLSDKKSQATGSSAVKDRPGEAEKEGDRGDDEPEQENLPLVEKGEAAKVEEGKIEDKMTQPPPEYTEALLLGDMTNPSRYVSEEELKQIFKGEVGLGTQATRAQIIETLLTRQYLVREKKKVMATEKGCLLIDHLRQFKRAKVIATPEETARWEMELEKIAQGIGDSHTFMAEIRQFVSDGVQEFKMSDTQQKAQGDLGQCPSCGGNIIEGKKGFGCSNWREQDGGCRFVVWKEISGTQIEPEMLLTLLSKKVTPMMTFQSKEGKEFQAALRLEYDKREKKWTTRFAFEGESSENTGEESSEDEPAGPLGKCPRCGGELVETAKSYGCSNWREQDGGCRFAIWKDISGKRISRKTAMELIEKKEAGPISGFVSRRTGKEFSARLKLEEESYKTVFVFD